MLKSFLRNVFLAVLFLSVFFAEEEVTSLSQYGITWEFEKPVRSGKYITGDFWIIGPVTIKSISPSPSAGRHGSVVNPPAGNKQGYDDRLNGLDPALQVQLPLELKPGQSLVSTISVKKVGERTPDTVAGQYCRGPVQTAAVLTCVPAAPPADSFRPAYVGAEKLNFTAGQLRREMLPKVKAAGKVPETAGFERYLQRIWLDHWPDWASREMHPMENMPDYGREITNIVSTVSLMLVVEDPEGKHEKLLLKFVQLGIDYYGVTRSNNKLWYANGGHDSGRKIPIIFAGVLLNHDGMKNVKAIFAEDDQTYYGEGYRGQKVLWKIDPSEARKHEHLPPDKWKGPPFVRDNDGWKSEGYRGLNGPTWVGQALAARMLGAKNNWDHNAYFDYVDRWVLEAPNGRVDQKTLKPAGYNAFPSDFVKAMWEEYRGKADEIGVQNINKLKSK